MAAYLGAERCGYAPLRMSSVTNRFLHLVSIGPLKRIVYAEIIFDAAITAQSACISQKLEPDFLDKSAFFDESIKVCLTFVHGEHSCCASYTNSLGVFRS